MNLNLREIGQLIRPYTDKIVDTKILLHEAEVAWNTGNDAQVLEKIKAALVRLEQP